MLSADDCLGLTLVYGRLMGADFVLCPFFGLTHSPVNLWLRFGRAVLVALLRNHPQARVRMPTDNMVTEYK